MNKGTKIWYKTGDLSNAIGIVKGYAGEGYYWIENIETEMIYYCLLTDIKQF